MEGIEFKICESCKEVKSVSEFYFRKETGKYRAACKKCKSVNTIAQITERVNSPIKTCKHCNLEKHISEYQKAGGGKWTQPYCKSCDAKRKSEYCIKNQSRLKEKYKNYYLNNKDAISQKSKKERMANRPETLKRIRSLIDARKMSPEEKRRRKSECDHRYRKENWETIRVRKKEYYMKYGRQQARNWQKKMMLNPEFVTKKRLRGRIYVALKRGVKSESTMKLLGCSIEEFKKYFESLFAEGMTWEKYLEGGIHIDHIIPCKKFDLTNPEEQKKCFHYTNLQPLWKLDNLKKGTSLTYNHRAA